jgi:AcrR family transcriptional regulator
MAVNSGRRTQAERSEATRAALLDATIECLIEDGYANTTTARVAQRAGVSRGAHLHHFQARASLVAAAVNRWKQRREEELLAAAERLPVGPERVREGLDLLWTTAYANPLFQAALELWSAARTDPELRSELAEFEQAYNRGAVEWAERLFPDLALLPDFEKLIEFALATMRGVALLDTLHGASGRDSRREWPHCRDRLTDMLTSARQLP